MELHALGCRHAAEGAQALLKDVAVSGLKRGLLGRCGAVGSSGWCSGAFGGEEAIDEVALGHGLSEHIILRHHWDRDRWKNPQVTTSVCLFPRERRKGKLPHSFLFFFVKESPRC